MPLPAPMMIMPGTRSNPPSLNRPTRLLPRLATAICLAACVQTPAAEEQPITDHKVAHVNWGDPIEGDTRPAFDPAALAGKVVVVEEFGVKIPDCLSRLKDLSRLAKKVARDKSPVAIIVIHRQREVPDKEILDAVKRVESSIAVRKNGFLPAYHEGMPNAAIFDATGTMCWTGNPMDNGFDRALKEAIGKAGE